ncbi:YbaB/EbfC family nucleoid-associated protein [Amycolatopsis silviterrae]|uniref:YbaB/EbfC family nucleoid-associated protein n=1 Tax=Amycolatopsis silviterrae TaxID=1656914 RepID=A0ABW5HLD3_9PSEU
MDLTAARIDEINRELGTLEGHAESRSGLVEAVVGVCHELRSLSIDPRVYRERDVEALAGDITEAMRAACAEVDRKAFAVGRVLLPDGADSATAALAYDPLLHELEKLIGKGPNESRW